MSEKETFIIETEQLQLRELTEQDFNTWHAILSDAETMQYYPSPFTEEKTRQWIAWNLDNYEKYGFGLWAVCLKETGEMIGDCGITLQNIHGDGRLFPEIGFHLNKKYWKKGYASQAAEACLLYAFAHTGYREIFCYQKSTNLPSRKMAEKLGMNLREEHEDPKNTKTSVYSITRKEWEKRLTERYEAWCFGSDAPDLLVALTYQGKKCATASAHPFYIVEECPLPKPGDLNVILNTAGEVSCMIRTTAVRVLPFMEVDERQAAMEGEGDGSLAFWRRVHRYAFSKELVEINETFSEDMLVVCEEFEVVYRALPEVYAPCTSAFWDDPNISKYMLEAHLNPEWDAATRPLSVVDSSVDWITDLVKKQEKGDTMTLLDLGCGPGLYAERLARKGFQVTGVDFSKRSITYATEHAQKEKLQIAYRYQNYLTVTDKELYDVVTLIYCDLGVMSPQDRHTVLENAYRALKPGGRIIVDAYDQSHHNQFEEKEAFFSAENGFWSDKPHSVYERSIYYPETNNTLELYVVTTEDSYENYYIWNQVYTATQFTEELCQAGFHDVQLYGDVTGAEYTGFGDALCAVACK